MKVALLVSGRALIYPHAFDSFEDWDYVDLGNAIIAIPTPVHDFLKRRGFEWQLRLKLEKWLESPVKLTILWEVQYWLILLRLLRRAKNHDGYLNVLEGLRYLF